MTLEVGHESWDIAPAHGVRAAVHGDRKFITALARGLEVLRVFTPTEGAIAGLRTGCGRWRAAGSGRVYQVGGFGLALPIGTCASGGNLEMS